MGLKVNRDKNKVMAKGTEEDSVGEVIIEERQLLLKCAWIPYQCLLVLVLMHRIVKLVWREEEKSRIRAVRCIALRVCGR